MARGKDFELNVYKWTRKVGDRADIVFRKLVLDMFGRVVDMSPVDTGRFKGNWTVNIGAPLLRVTDQTDVSGQSVKSAIGNVAARVRAGKDVVYMNNSLPYANRLEYGWSQQAPNGMVRVTVRQFRALVDRAVAQAKAERP